MRNTVRFRVAVVLVLLLLGSERGFAQIVAYSRAYKVVSPGHEVSITWFMSLNPDCSSRGEYTIRLLSEPRGGQIFLKRGPEFPLFPKTNDRSVCDSRRRTAEHIVYRASPGFAGVDTFDVEVIDPDNTARKYRYGVNVEQ